MNSEWPDPSDTIFTTIEYHNFVVTFMPLDITANIHSEKGPAKPMLFYSTKYWQQF